MNPRTPLVCLLCALGLMLLAACGGSGPGTGTTTTSAGESASTTASAVDMSAGELGDAIGATWSEAMQKLVALLESKPEAVAIQGQVEQLKEEYIGKLVQLGRQREALGVSDKAKAGVRTVAALDAAGDEAWYVGYKSLYEHYSEGELGFANLLASFNILTQYAEFELLKQQAPEEATRLGIE